MIEFRRKPFVNFPCQLPLSQGHANNKLLESRANIRFNWSVKTAKETIPNKFLYILL